MENHNKLEKLVVNLVIKGLTLLEYILPKWKIWNKQLESSPQLFVIHASNRIKHSAHSRFQKCRRDHNILNIIMTPCNYNVSVFIPSMAAVGMVFCIFLNYAVLSLYHRTDMRLLFCVAFNLNGAIHWLIQFFCLHASLPKLYTEETIHVFKANVKRKEIKRQVHAMRSFGFSLGGFFIAKKRTGLDMFETILSYTTTLLVL